MMRPWYIKHKRRVFSETEDIKSLGFFSARRRAQTLDSRFGN